MLICIQCYAPRRGRAASTRPRPAQPAAGPNALLANVGTAGSTYFLKVNNTGHLANASAFCARGSTYLNPDMGGTGLAAQGFRVQKQKQKQKQKQPGEQPAGAEAETTVKLVSTECAGLCAALDAPGASLVLASCDGGGASVLWTTDKI